MKKELMKKIAAALSAAMLTFSAATTGVLRQKDSIQLTAEAATSAYLEVSDSGIQFICSLEGFHSTCYSDYSQSSIGYGTKCTGSSQQPHASGSHSITKEAAMAALKEQLNDTYAPRVRSQTAGIEMTQNQFDALVSLCFNCGGGTTRISSSPLVKYLKGELTESEARSQYSNYIVTAGGSRLQGLVNRRNAEADYFFSGEGDDNDEELGIPYPRPTGSPLIRKGSKGRSVGWVQYALSAKLGYDIGSAGVDCDFGSATESAVKAFQSDNGLDADGIVGPATVNGLCDAIRPRGECKLEVASDYITINKNIEQKAAVDCTYYNTRRDVSNFKLQYSCEQKNALHLEWGEWRGRTCALNISANSIGTVKVTVKLLNSDNDEVLATKDITVVSTGDTSVNLSSTSVTLNLDKNETQDIVATVKGFPRDGNMDYTGKTDAAEVILIDKIIENNTPKLTFRIKPLAAGKEEIRFSVKNGAGQVVAEAKANVTVVLDTKTVSFDSNGGKCSTTEKAVKFNSTYGELPVPTREGYTFDGWYTAKDGGTRVNASTIMSNTADHTLYAHWTGKAVDITLIDELSGAEEQFSAKYGEKFNISMLRKTSSDSGSDPTADKLLMGWSDRPDGEVVIKSGDIIKPVRGQETASMTLYARWISPKLTLRVNGQESYEAAPGETVNVTLEVEGAANAYGTFQSRFTFSPELQLTDGKTGQAFSVTAAKSDSIVALAGAASKNCGGNGVLYSCNITIPESAPRGEAYPLELLFDDHFILRNLTDDKITAEMQKYAASHSKGCVIKVREFSVANTDVTLHNGEQYEIAASEEAVTYSSSNTKIAVVSKTGVITAVGEGTAKISVITSDSEVVQIDVTVVGAKEAVMYGDVNLDGKVTAADATAIMQYIANRDKYTLSEQSIINADICGNGDGITAMDALMIQQLDSGLITEAELISE